MRHISQSPCALELEKVDQSKKNLQEQVREVWGDKSSPRVLLGGARVSMSMDNPFISFTACLTCFLPVRIQFLINPWASAAYNMIQLPHRVCAWTARQSYLHIYPNNTFDYLLGDNVISEVTGVFLFVFFCLRAFFQFFFFNIYIYVLTSNCVFTAESFRCFRKKINLLVTFQWPKLGTNFEDFWSDIWLPLWLFHGSRRPQQTRGGLFQLSILMFFLHPWSHILPGSKKL